ncbi:hypothetical protein GCM10018954_005610 [Kutzneria kofuensis]
MARTASGSRWPAPRASTAPSATCPSSAPRRCRTKLPLAPGLDWHKGLLAGIFDARGSVRDGVPRIFTRDARLLDAICLALKELDFDHHVTEDRRAVVLTADLAERLRFRQTVDPATAGRLALDGELAPGANLTVTKIERLDTRHLYDITTGTGDFVADGVVSHNCSCSLSTRTPGAVPCRWDGSRDDQDKRSSDEDRGHLP